MFLNIFVDKVEVVICRVMITGGVGSWERVKVADREPITEAVREKGILIEQAAFQKLRLPSFCSIRRDDAVTLRGTAYSQRDGWSLEAPQQEQM